MTRRDVVVIGASAGGVEALSSLASGLPEEFPGSILVVLHMPEGHTSALAQILRRAGPLAVREAEDGESLPTRAIAISPADHHLVVEGSTVRVIHGPRENGFRPAIDPLFRSAARSLGERVVAVLLSGTRDDGVAGLSAIKRHGGLVVVQDPADALFDILPKTALEVVPADEVLPVRDIGPVLAEMAGVAPEFREREGARSEPNFADPVRKRGITVNAAANDDVETGLTDEQTSRPPSSFTCPECSGALWELKEGTTSKLVCRIGHGFTPEVLFELQGHALEATLWSALRALEERADLAQRLATRLADRGQQRSANSFRERMHESSHHAAVLRTVLFGEAAAAIPEVTGEPS